MNRTFKPVPPVLRASRYAQIEITKYARFYGNYILWQETKGVSVFKLRLVQEWQTGRYQKEFLHMKFWFYKSDYSNLLFMLHNIDQFFN